MLAFLIWLGMTALVGVCGYLSSAWFGYRSSGSGHLPPHYQKLAKRFKPDKAGKKLDNEFMDS